MNETSELIFPQTQIINRCAKEHLLGQKAKAFWLTGLSCSGKSTIGQRVAQELFQRNYTVQVLDGDNIRNGINKDLSFSEEDRIENIRRAAEISKLFIESGIITINCFITPTSELRSIAQNIIGEDDYIEVFINTTIEECKRRDIKGLYEKARFGKVKHFPGVNAPFEAPQQPHIIIENSDIDIDIAVQKLIAFMLPLIQKQNK